MLKSPLVIGLTGGIGSGKSEVTRRFSALGIEVVDADEVAREVVAPGEDALRQIALHFGQTVITPQGELDRASLRHIIFTNPPAKRWLEALLHPLINNKIRLQLTQARSPYVILSSPLLLETGQYELVDRVLVIDTSEELQLERASRRDNTNAEQIKTIMQSQIARAQRLARADDVIHNLGDLDNLDGQVTNLHQKYLLLVHPHTQT